MTQKKKRPGGNPQKQPHIDEHPMAKQLYRRLQEGVQLTHKFQDHVEPRGDCLITLEQWRFLRGSVVNDLALYAHITGKPSPINMIVESEQQRVLIEIEEPV
jgi:hypothetical protein